MTGTNIMYKFSLMLLKYDRIILVNHTIDWLRYLTIQMYYKMTKI
jgi:hypothetical protein